MPHDGNPILNNPYEEPFWHYATNFQGELDYSRPVRGRRVFTPEVQTIPIRWGAQGDLMELSDLARAATKKRAEQTLKIEIDDEAFSRIYGHKSHAFPVKKGQKIAVRVIRQFGEETTKVLEVK